MRSSLLLKSMRIGLIGFGTIGKAVATAVDNRQAGDVEISRILVRDTSRIDVEDGTRERLTNDPARFFRSEEHTSELQSRFGISYAVFCLKKKRTPHLQDDHGHHPRGRL